MVATLFCYKGGFHTGDTAADDQNILFYFCRFQRILIDQLEGGVDGAGNPLAEHDAVQTAQTADAGTNLMLSAFFCFVGEFRFAQICPADHAGIRHAVGDHFFRDPCFGDAAHGGNGNIDPFFDMCRKFGMGTHLCAGGGDGTAPLDGGAAGHMDQIHAGLFQLLGNVGGIVDIQTAVAVFVTGDADVDDEVLAADTPDLFHHFQGQPQPAVDIAAVFIAALVVQRGQETTQQTVGMGCVDFHTVAACGLYALCGLAELTHQNFQLIPGYRTRGGSGVIGSHVGGGDQLGRSRNGECHVGGVEQLGQDFGIVFVDLGAQLFPAGNKGIVMNGHVAGEVDIGRLHGHHFGHNQAHTALGPGAVMLYQFVGYIAFAGQICGDGRHKYTVFGGFGSDLNGFE